MQAMTVAVTIRGKDKLTPVVNKINNKLTAFQHKTESMRKSAAKIGAVGTAGFMAMGSMLLKPIKSAIAFESAMADVKKVVNFKPNTGELKAFTDEILGLTSTIPLTAKGLAAIAASGGQLGIAKDKIIGFTTVVAKMSTAFDMVPEQAGDSVAKLMNIYGLSIKEVTSLGDAINHLSDGTAAKANNMVNVLARVGGTAKMFGLNAVQVSSLADAFLAMGKSPEVASTAINAMLQKLNTADKQGKKFQQGLHAIGLSATKMKHMIKKDANGAIMSLLENIKRFDKQKQMGILSDMFGMEYSDDIALLISGLDNYKKALGLVSDKEKYAGSMQREFAERSKTTANQMIILDNSINRIGINMGSVLLPKINSTLKAITQITDSVSVWASENKDLVESIMTWGGYAVAGLGGLSALTLGFSALMFSMTPVIKIFKGFGWMLTRFGAKSATATTAVKALDKTLNAVAGKSVSARLGVMMPKEQTLLGKFRSIFSGLARFAVANPIMIAAVVTAGAVGAMATAQHTQIMDNRVASSSDSTDVLKAKIERYESRIKAMKGEGDFTGRAKEWLLNGNATESGIKQQEKLLAFAKKRLAQKSKGVVAIPQTKEEQTTVSAVRVPTVKAKTKVWSKEEIAQARANAYKARDARKAEVSKSIQTVELKKPIVKSVTNTKNISVSPTIHITVNAVQGNVDANHLGQTIGKHIEAAARNASNASSFEDQE